MSINKAGTFVYSPDINAAISTINHGIVDISSDIVSFDMELQINNTSTFTCVLNNPNRKYNSVINTMDRITVFLKRTNYVQCFTGLITYAPIVTLVPTPITINASCTLYLLQNTYWDDTLLQYQQLLLNNFDPALYSSDQTYNDGGIAQSIVNVLYKVCGWNPNAIHIQGIPPNFVQFASFAWSNLVNTQYAFDQNVYNQLGGVLSINGVVGGQTITNLIPPDLNPPDGGVGVQISASYVKPFITTPINGNKQNFPGSNPDNPVVLNLVNEDIYYCAAPFSYLSQKNQGKKDRAKAWLSHNSIKNTDDGRLLILSNQQNSRSVAVRATSIPQKPNTSYKGSAVYDPTVDHFQCHPGVVAYLNGVVSSPSNWTPKTYTSSQVDVSFEWADKKTIIVGPQVTASPTIPSTYTVSPSVQGDINTAIATLIYNLRGQIGDKYTQNQAPGAPTRTNPGQYGSKSGTFDCSGLAYWGYSTIGITLPGSNTTGECGPITGTSPNMTGLHPEIYGAWFPNTQQPQVGDLLFWEVTADDTPLPQHVTILSVAFDKNGNGKSIQANQPGYPLNEDSINWPSVRGGQWQSWGGRLIGCRRPITLHHGWGSTFNQNISSPTTSPYLNTETSANVALNPYDAYQRSSLTLTNAYNTYLLTPQFDIRASALQGSPGAFVLDHPVLQDLTTIIGAGLRQFQSAPNGDFVAWFPDYYGIYGTDPALEISPVELLDFQIYHDDTQLATHVAIIGDTNGIGQQVGFADYLSFQGIVSIQDITTMQILFGGVNTINQPNEATNTQNVVNFLNRYGLRPYFQEQSVIQSHALEYIYALYTFMTQWANQFASTVPMTFMPELYPGMRVYIKVDNESGGVDQYEFYTMSVSHTGDRVSGFTTNAVLTAPKKNGQIFHYGLEFVS